MKRILHIITDLPVGGAQMMLYRLLGRLDKSVFESQVVSLGRGGKMAEMISELGVAVHAVNRSFGRLHQATVSFQPDLIQGWMYHGNIASLLETVRIPARVLMVWNIRHSLYDLKKEKTSTAWLIRIGAWTSSRPARILYNSRVAAEQHAALGYRQEKAMVIPNGFDCEQFKPDPEARISVRRELSVSDATILIGQFARLHPMKDHRTFLEAASLLVRAGKDVQFILAGSGIDQSGSAIVKQAEDLGLAGRVHFLGEQSDMSRLNAALDIATSSSSYGEAFPNAIGEAMACGVPCVATEVGDASDLIGDAGKLVAPGNPEALARAWTGLVDAGREERMKLGARARDRILQRFTLDRVVTQYQELYLSLTEPQPK